MSLTVSQYIDTHRERFLQELFSLLRLPSISADPTYSREVMNTANAVAEFLTKAGATGVKIHPTAGHPIVYGEKIISSTAPTVLVYGHYDVQPADPIDLWQSPPFDPQIRDGNIYARGMKSLATRYPLSPSTRTSSMSLL